MTVLHHVQRWLPLSEHFVHGHVTRSRHRGVVGTAAGRENAEVFGGVRVWPLPSRPRAVRTAALVAIASVERVRVVHAHFGYRAPDVIGLCRRRRLPLVVSLHGHDATAFARRWPHHYDALLPEAAAWVVPSRFLADAAEGLGAPADRIQVIPVGVDTAWFTPTPLPDGPPTVVFVGRLVEKKGVDVLLDAWPSVRSAVPDARLVVVGEGPLADLVRDGSEGVEHRVPEVARRAAQVRDALREATVVATPSRTTADGDVESCLLVNLEAQASGRPVVTTRHGGIPEFVEDGASALLVPEGDAPALADALVDVLRVPGRLSGGPAVAARFDVRDCTERVDALYDRLAGSLGQ